MRHNITTRVRDQRGIVSLISVTLAGILLTIVVTSIVLIAASEARQSAQADLSSRAYYAAQAGAEEGIREVKTALANGGPSAVSSLAASSTCGTNSGDTTFGQNVNYSCLRINSQVNALSGTLVKDGSPVLVDLTSVPNAAYLEVSWNSANDAPVTSTTTFPSAFAATSQWVGKPAVMDVSAIQINYVTPPTIFNPLSGTKIFKQVLVPSTSSGPSLSAVATPSVAHSTACTAASSSGYSCTQLLSIPANANQRYVFSLLAHYSGTDYRVRVLDSTSTVISGIPDQYATIDVTAQSGTVYRRLRTKVALYKGTAALDYALFSDEDLCKDFQLRDSKTGTASVNTAPCPY